MDDIAKLTAKERHRETLVGYLANPDNEFPTRKVMSEDILGFSSKTVLYKHFTVQEINQIEADGLEARRNRYSSKLAAVDSGLLRQAATGDAQAAKLAFQRYEGWTEKQKSEVTFNGPMLQQVLNVFPAEIQAQIKEALVIKQQKELT
jgi:hypothetical protein